MRFKNRLSAKEYQDLCDFEGMPTIQNLLKPRMGWKEDCGFPYATFGAFTKYPKESLPKKPSHQVSDKKFGVFKMKYLLLKWRTPWDCSKISEPLLPSSIGFLVEAADDICYTLIDFEDGINLGLIEEEFALEYLVNLVRDKLQSKNTVNLRRPATGWPTFGLGN